MPKLSSGHTRRTVDFDNLLDFKIDVDPAFLDKESIKSVKLNKKTKDLSMI